MTRAAACRMGQSEWAQQTGFVVAQRGGVRDALWLQPKRWEDEMFQDLRFGVRMLLKHKGFTLVAVLSLALGIGANTAIFSLMDAVLLKMLPVERPEQLYFIQNVGPRRPVVARRLTRASSGFGIRISPSPVWRHSPGVI